jgi:ubiquinone/menaquinone biosynthesis C-methylase UbiE
MNLKKEKTFWDISAPVYNFAQHHNGGAYKMLPETILTRIPDNSTVLEVACGTAEISLKIAAYMKKILCTDTSYPMLKIANKNAIKQGIDNIAFRNMSIYDLKLPDKSFDVTIASQVLHLLDDPQKAVNELIRVTKKQIILPITLTAEVAPLSKVKLGIWKLFGFSPKKEFDFMSYAEFINDLFNLPETSQFCVLYGGMPMAVASVRL